jgi:hypothetical protein
MILKHLAGATYYEAPHFTVISSLLVLQYYAAEAMHLKIA